MFVLCERPDSDLITVLADERSFGRPLRAYAVPASMCCSDCLSAYGSGQGLTTVVNGMPVRYLPRHPVSGDYVQFHPGVGLPDSIPTGSLLDLCPGLEAFTWPLCVGDGPGRLHVHNSFRLRRRAQGPHLHLEGTIEILGPFHGPVRFRFESPHSPTTEDAERGACQFQDCPAARLQLFATMVIRPDRSVFVSTDPRLRHQCVLFPLVAWPGVMLPLLILPEALVEFPLPEGGIIKKPRQPWANGRLVEVLILPPEARPYAYYIIEGIPLPPIHRASRASGSAPSGGTSLAQLPHHEAKWAIRCARLRALHPHVNCPCKQGAFVCLPAALSEQPPSQLLAGFVPATGCNTLSVQGPDGSLERCALPSERADEPDRPMIPTPFGRRCILRQDLTSSHTEKPPAVAGNERAVVRLDSAVPSLSMRAGPGRLQLGVTPEMFEHVFREYHLGLFHSDWRLVPGLLPQTVKFLAAMPDLPPGTMPSALQLFVDGSYIASSTGPPQCGWAVCALGFHKGCWYWIGWFASHTDPRGDFSTLGDKVSSAYEVELAAMCFALAVGVGVQAQCLIGFDSTSASLVAAAQGVDANGRALASACRSLCHILELRKAPPLWHHIPSHKGHPLNEFVDAAAKFGARQHQEQDPPTTLHEAQVDGVLAWLWATTGLHPSVPRPDGKGLLADAESVRAEGLTLQQVGPPDSAVTGRLAFDFKAVTYNALTLQSKAQQESISAQLHKRGIHVAGLQETRSAATGRSGNSFYHVLASPAHEGQLGCQLWLSKAMIVATCRGEPVHWDVASFSIIHAEPRMLLATARAGSQWFAFLVGHSPTAKADRDLCEAFWQKLSSTLRRAPPRCTPILLLDANAKQFGCRSADLEEGEQTVNHQELARLISHHQLSTSGHLDASGQDFTTWQGPDGQTACIDYVLYPDALAPGVVVEGPLQGFVGYLDHDHKPVAVRFQWCLQGACHQRPPRLAIEVLHTPEGRRQLRDLYRTMPPVGWEVSVDQHLLLLNEHLLTGLRRICARAADRPRDQVTSAHTWQLIKDRRAARREVHRTKGSVLSAEYHALLGEQIKDLTRLIRGSARADTAEALRVSFQDARTGGIEALHRLCRNLAKTGRRYRAPSLSPSLHLPDGSAAPDSYRVLGDNFAAQERASHCHMKDVVTREPCYAQVDFEAAAQFNIDTLCNAFCGLQARRAAGWSGIPVEAYKFAPLEAAHHHVPLLLKAQLRRQCPMLWRGGRATAIPKSLKSPHGIEGWRSILLLENGSKAVAKALRGVLVTGYRRLQQDAQGGSVPGQPLQASMAHVRGLIRRMRESGQAGGILFVDGRSAFYAVLRSALLGSDAAAPQAFFEQLASEVFADPAEQASFLLHTLGPGLLEQVDLPLAIRRFVASCLDETWFCIGDVDMHAYRTRSGRVPGAPGADIYFQFIFSRVLAKIQEDLEEAELAAYCPVAGTSQRLRLPIPTWMDGFAVPLMAPRPEQLLDRAGKAVQIVSSAMKSAGIRLNLSRGKTEFLPVVCGPHSRTLRQQWLCAAGGTFPVHIEGCTVQVHLTGQYVHLGAAADASGRDTPDISRRRDLARQLSRDIAPLLRNPHLLEAEKTGMLLSMPLARLRHGAGFWGLGTAQDRSLYYGAYAEVFRRPFRAICGFSSHGLPDAAIYDCLGVLTAQQAHQADVIRHAGWLLADGSPVLKALWFQDGPWVQTVRAALSECSQLLADDDVQWNTLHDSPELAKAWTRRFTHRCRSNQQAIKADVRPRWERFAREQAQGVLYVHVNKGHVFPVDHMCPECGVTCASSAALGSHRRKVHGVRARATDVAIGTRCDVCHTEYWSTMRLRDHLRRSEACLRVWEAADRDAEGTVIATPTNWLPATTAYGPHPWWSLLRPPAMPTAAPLPEWDRQAFLKEWLQRESSKVTDTQLRHLVEKGMFYVLSDDDLPLTCDFQSPTTDLVQGALWAAQQILVQSTGSRQGPHWLVAVSGDRVCFRPNAASKLGPLPAEWEFG